MTNILRSAVLTAASLFALFAFDSAAIAGNLIKNGGFEKPEAPTGGLQQILPGELLCVGDTCTAGWTAVGPPGSDVLLVGMDYKCCGATFPPDDGEQSLCLTGNNHKRGGVAQTIATKKKKRYRIRFAVGNLVNAAQGLGTTSTVKLYVDGKHVDDFTNNQGSANTVTWQDFSVVFKATKAHTEIKFINGDPSNDGYNGLDSVRVDLVTAPDERDDEP